MTIFNPTLRNRNEYLTFAYKTLNPTNNEVPENFMIRDKGGMKRYRN